MRSSFARSHPSPLAPLCRASRGAPTAPPNTPRHLTRRRASFPSTPLTVISSSVVAKPPFGSAARAPPPHSKPCCPLTGRRVGMKCSGIRDPGGVEAGSNPCFKNFHPPVRGHDATNVSRQDTAWEGPWGCLGLFGAVVGAAPGAAPTFSRAAPTSQRQPEGAAEADIGDILFSTQLLNDPSKKSQKFNAWSETRKGVRSLFQQHETLLMHPRKDSRLLIRETMTIFFLALSLKKASCHTDVSTLVFR